MRTIILAAGVGRRLGAHGKRPKCLLDFGGRSLLQRHIDNLHACGAEDIAICVGYERDLIAAHLNANSELPVELITNDDYREGSVISLWATREVLNSGEDIVLMDADVLYDRAILARLFERPARNRFLSDANFIAGEEPVKLCRLDERIVEFRKRLAPDLKYNACGESVGFFSFTAEMAEQLAAKTQSYVDAGRRDEPYEEAIRDIVLAEPSEFDVEDITGLPWIEIDFAEDIETAERQILPQISHD